MSVAPTIAQRLARFAFRADAVPATVTDDVARRVRDLIGNSLAAADSEPAEVISRIVDAAAGAPQAGMIGRPGRAPASLAALFNGTVAHALDFDDTHLPSVLHPSASVIPAALAVAQARGASGASFSRAVAVGDEITIRLGMAGYDERSRDSVYFAKGFHATSICGTVGAAAAAAVLYGLDADAISHALAIAASLGAGLLEANRTGGSVKRIHCGWAAHAGISAAEMAAAGLTGPPTAFEGRFGFLQAFLDERFNANAITRGLGRDWELVKMFFKPYPCNHFTQAGIDAALELRRRGLDPDEVAEVELGVPGAVLRTIAEPAAEKAAPPNGYTARFSGPFTFATALVGGGGLGVYLDDFTDEGARDERRLALARRVRCVADPECDAIFPFEFPAIARVRTTAGTHLEVKVLHNRGGPSNPLSVGELKKKFALNAERALAPERVARLDELLDRLIDLGGVGELLEYAAP
ncbi:MAG TPA: MmgE/PrpD family protein [Solirubrobacteraceae bacterium]|jgi:2-methylcitrate dehydratase PrpD